VDLAKVFLKFADKLNKCTFVQIEKTDDLQLRSKIRRRLNFVRNNLSGKSQLRRFQHHVQF
jgi:hypothetical protein